MATPARTRGVARRNRLLLAAAFALPIMLGVTVGYWGVRGQAEVVQFSLLAFTAGVLTTVRGRPVRGGPLPRHGRHRVERLSPR
ncbi:MAG: hypothetical protein M3N68_05800, partial [Actinomycetota bacterium]|nr:hypothetical protein [Actinomycetota bacterium]